MCDYKLWQLDNFARIKWGQFKLSHESSQNYAHVFLTNEKHITQTVGSAEQAAKDLKALLGSKLKKELNIRSILDLPNLSECDDLINTVLLINNQEKISSALIRATFSKIRDCLNNTNSSTIFSLLTNASFYQALIDNVIYSRLPSRQYLLVPSVFKEIDTDGIRKEHLWAGEGWLTPSITKEQKKNSIDTAYSLIWDNKVSDMLYKLALSSCLAQSGDKKYADPSDIKYQKNLYLLILEACIPFQHFKKEIYIQSHTRPWTGPFEISSSGPFDPVLLINGTRDSKYHSAIRDLILEGWLGMWEHNGKLIAHTASLVLLYWTAKHLGKKHTENPDSFIANYDIDPRAGWFGGQWGKELLEN